MRKRPVSPHLQIYNIFSKELTSAMSIVHRFAEIGVFIGILYVAIFFIFLSFGENTYNLYINFLSSWFGVLSLLGISAGMWFYIFNALRFTLINLGIGINKKFVMVSGYIALACFVIATAITWFYILFM